MNRKEIYKFLTKFNINDIEKALVYIFVQQNNIKIKKNKFIKEFILNVDKKIINEFTIYFEKNNYILNLKNLERCFELLIEDKERKLNGVFYTPDFIVEYICNKAINSQLKKDKITICDPACGSGAFLVKAAEILAKKLNKNIKNIIEENIYGVDISERSVNRAKIMLTLLALLYDCDIENIKFNIKQADSLSMDWHSFLTNVEKFDIVIGNPPYVRIQNLPPCVRENLRKNWLTAKTGNTDLYIPFFELGLKLINENGIIGYITPSSYFSSKAGKELRRLLQENHYIREIINFGDLQIFEDVTTYTAITFLDKDKNKNCFYYYEYDKIPKKIEIKNNEFKRIRFSILEEHRWLFLDDEEYKKIKTIENVGIPLNKIANISVGIATLRDKLYILNSEYEEDNYYIKIYKGKKYKIEKDITKKILKVSMLKSEEDIEKNKNRIIWPYKNHKNKIVPIDENELKDRFPYTYNYLLSIKNELDKRDKGQKKYIPWYSFGRTQALQTSFGKKILTSTLNKRPNFIICNDEDTTFYGGYCIKTNRIKLKILKKILNSDIMDFYIKKTSRPYRGGYKSFAKSFIERFSIPYFTQEEMEYIEKENDPKKLNKFLNDKYFKNIDLYVKKFEQLKLELKEPKLKYL